MNVSTLQPAVCEVGMTIWPLLTSTTPTADRGALRRATARHDLHVEPRGAADLRALEHGERRLAIGWQRRTVHQEHRQGNRRRTGRWVLRDARTGSEHPDVCALGVAVERNHQYVSGSKYFSLQLQLRKGRGNRTAHRLWAHSQYRDLQAGCSEPGSQIRIYIVRTETDRLCQRNRIDIRADARSSPVDTCTCGVHPHRQESSTALLDSVTGLDHAVAGEYPRDPDTRMPGERQFPGRSEDTNPVRSLRPSR